MLIRIIIILSLTSLISFGQSQEKKDSVINEVCKFIHDTKGQPDSARIATAFQTHLYPFLSKYSEQQQSEIWESIYFRLQRNCKEFKEILERIDPPKGDWQTVSEKPITTLSKKICKDFLNHKKYQYLEASGDTVNIEFKDEYWIDKFKDGTYSKLKFHWITDCEFDIEFVESNNLIRKNFSKPGDKYRYQLIDKKETYYDISVEILGTNRYFLFKIHY